MAASFAFVMYAGPANRDADSARLVRQHVMRDMVKGRRPAGHKSTSSADSHGVIDAEDTRQTLLRVPLQSKISPYKIGWLGAGRSDLFAQFPIEIDGRSMELIEHISSSINAALKMLSSQNVYMWHPTDIKDPAAFHQLLSSAAVYRSTKRGEPLDSDDALTHHTMAMTIVKSRIFDIESSTSDGNLSAIASLCEYNVMTGNTGGWQLHMNGLKELIRLRGGPESLKYNEQLGIAVSWSDIIGSIIFDSVPNFPLLGHAIVQPAPIRRPVNIAEVWRAKFPGHHEMYDCLTELGEWTGIFLSDVVSTDGNLFTSFPISRGWGSWDHSVTSVVHRILSIQTEVNFRDEASVLQEACRLASWLYLAEIRHRFYIRRIDYPVQKEKLQALLQAHGKQWQNLEGLHLWVVMMAFLQSDIGPQRTWIVEEVRSVAETLGITSCLQAEDHLRHLLWIDAGHGRKLQAMKSEIWAG